MDSNSPPDIVVVAGGAPLERVPTDVSDARVIAADSGVALAMAIGLEIDIAVGDFDSLSPDLVDRLDEIAQEVRRHHPDKAATDLELALAAALEAGPARVLAFGLEGGRPDHALANLLVAASGTYASLDIELALELGRAWVVRNELCGRWPVGTTFSIIPVHGDAVVSVDGVRWPLDRSRLVAGTTRGVSNTTTESPTTVTVHDGVAICIVPINTENNP